MGLLGFVNKLVGFGDPIKLPQQNPDINNQLNALRQMIAQYGNTTGDRYYDIARSRITNDAYLQAQNMGQALNRAMNRRGVLNSGLTAQGQAQVQQGLQQQIAQQLSQLEAQRVQDQERRRAQTIDWFAKLLGLETGQDQFNRQMALNTQMQNFGAQQWFANMLGGLGQGIGSYWSYKNLNNSLAGLWQKLLNGDGGYYPSDTGS